VLRTCKTQSAPSAQRIDAWHGEGLVMVLLGLPRRHAACALLFLGSVFVYRSSPSLVDDERGGASPTVESGAAPLCAPCFGLDSPGRVPRAPGKSRMCYIHVPKCGSSFWNTVMHYTCPGLADDCWFHNGPDKCHRLSDLGQVSKPAPRLKDPGIFRNFAPPSWEVPLDPSVCDRGVGIPLGYFPGDAPYFSQGYWHRSLIEKWCEAEDAVIMMRDPVQRMLSHYFGKDLTGPCTFATPKECAASQKGCYTKMLVGLPCGNPYMIRELYKLSGDRWGRLKRGEGVGQSPLMAEALFNMSQGVTVDMVRQAVRNLERMDFVGLTDHWTESVCLFHKMHGTSPTAPEFLNNRPGGSSVASIDAAKHATTKHDTSALDGWWDEADEVVYRAAKARFRRDMQRHTTCPSPVGEGEATGEALDEVVGASIQYASSAGSNAVAASPLRDPNEFIELKVYDLLWWSAASFGQVPSGSFGLAAVVLAVCAATIMATIGFKVVACCFSNRPSAQQQRECTLLE
jgi:hypothetical protein